MYERFYHLRDRPFNLSPDPDYLYPSRVHREALDYLRFGIEGSAGFVVITGEIGSGKTTLLQVLLRNLDGQTTVVRLVNTLLSGNELLESMLLDLGVEQPPPTKPTMLRDLARILVEERARGRRVVAVIDEAQNLSLEALEEIRMLSNLETEKSKLIQIVLVGQPNLRDKLLESSLEQLRQRVTVRYHIEPLDVDETARYINHRLSRAAIGAPLEFSPEVSAAVHERSRGVPRLINVICDAILLFGYAEERRQIDMDLVQAAFEELEASSVLRASIEPPQPPRPTARSAAAAAPPRTEAPQQELAARPTEGAAARPPQPVAPAATPAERVFAPTAPTVPAAPAIPVAAVAAPVRTAAPQAVRRQTDPVPRDTPAAWQRPPVAQPPAPGAAARPAPGAAAPARRVETPASRPVATDTFGPVPARPAGAWNWMKEVLFGPGTDTQRG